MPAKVKGYINREVSWLDFNTRVLELAKERELPLLERLKFLSISASNLDEFFMVRVGSLQTLRKARKRVTDAAGLSPAAQLKDILAKVRIIKEQQTEVWRDLMELLRAEGMEQLAPADVSQGEKDYLRGYCQNELFPLITPIPLNQTETQPLVRNLELYVAVRLAPADGQEEERLALLPIPSRIKRFRTLPGGSEGLYRYCLVEDVIRQNADLWFPHLKILEITSFRLTRNADIAVQEEEAGDLLLGMEEVLRARKISEAIRLELQEGTSRTMQKMLREYVHLQNADVFSWRCPVQLKDYMDLCFLEHFERLQIDAWPPQNPVGLEPGVSIFEQIAEKDHLLYHPFHSFNPVIRLLQQAAEDPGVLAIKQVLYRTSKDSPIIQALRQAAENGKIVTVLVELKARFDEARNIYWARELEESGVQVIYGIQGLKTHAKICLVVRREESGIVRYVHYGTGNYNDSTAKLYGDISYMTRREEYGSDASRFFNSVSAYTQPFHFQKVTLAPFRLRDRLVERIQEAIDRNSGRGKSVIQAKMNSLVDPVLIEKLYEASRAGVQIHLNIRGICCLTPGIPGLSENIRVTSIVDRFLEHTRIFHFRYGREDHVYISSADWMPRNLDRRVELMTPVEDPESRKKLIGFLESHLRDNSNAWELQADGHWMRLKPDGKKRWRSQEQLYKMIRNEVQEQKKNAPTALKPHRA